MVRRIVLSLALLLAPLAPQPALAARGRHRANGAVALPGGLGASPAPGAPENAGGRVPSAPAADEVRSITLLEAIQLATASSSKLEAAGFAEKAADHEMRSAEALKLPRLSVQNILKDSDNFKRFAPLGAIGPTLSDINNDSASISGAVLEVPVYVGDKLAILPRMARRRKEACQQLTRTATQDLILELVGLYLDILVGDKEQKLAEMRLEVKDAEVRAAREKAAADALAGPRLVTLELEADELRQRQLELSDAASGARQRLAVLTGLPSGARLSLGPTFDMRELEGGPADMLKVAKAENPELKLLEANLANSGEEIGLAASAEKMQVNFRADYFYDRPFDRPQNSADVWTVALMSSWNLFDGGFVDQEKRKARDKVREARAELTGGLQHVDLQIRQAYNNLAESRKLLDGQEKNIVLAREMLQTVSEKYQVNILSRADLQDARLNLMRAMVNRDRTRAAVLKQQAVLFRLMGRLESGIFQPGAVAVQHGERR